MTSFQVLRDWYATARMTGTSVTDAGKELAIDLPSSLLFIATAIQAVWEEREMVAGETANGREIRVTPAGKIIVQPWNDNYWLPCSTMADAMSLHMNPRADVPQTILDTRVPQPGSYASYGVPEKVAAEVDDLLSQRNHCDERMVGVIDMAIQTLLHDYRRNHLSWL